MDEECQKKFTDGNFYVFAPLDMSAEKKRTWLQNAALHLWFKWLAEWLSSSGFSVALVISKLSTETVQWTPKTVKEIIWRNIQRALFKKESSATLTTQEVTETYKHIVSFFCTRLKENPPSWPDNYNQSLENDKEKKI